MRKIIDIVRDLLHSSEPELTALSRRVLNLSAYAKRIHPTVEQQMFKRVKLGSIVVALSRISAELTEEDPLLPNVLLDSIAVKSNIAEITFDKNSANKMRAQKLYLDGDLAQADFLTITYGASEISIFLPMNLVQPTLLAFEPDRPKLCLENLAALTIQFATQYINTPNMYFALFRAIAVKRLNVVDVISTFTELTFLVRQSDLNELFVLMNSLMRKQEIAKSQPAVQPRPLPKSS